MRRLTRWLLITALSLSIGLQWAVVQGAAWVGMIVAYSQEATVAQSVAMTFDGSHPCELCKAVQRGESTPSTQNVKPNVLKLDLAAPEAGLFVFETPAVSAPAWIGSWSPAISTAPPTPPPRQA